ncbi:MAG: prepilin-type N-terminal cleavage/methylation domain-containing protein [Kiritimatiellae bacterium]|nr:prepilin-type N-terminal cleavage/methylation domain-containing protein [Kiritimatiellia bacterium]
MRCCVHPRFRCRRPASGFSLVELLVCVAIIGALLALMLPALGAARTLGARTVCQSNLRSMQLAFQQYLDEHEDRWFPFREDTPEGVLWYFGLERSGGSSAEGERPLDKTRARLAPYLGSGGGAGGVENCPSLPVRAPYFKRKFEYASYGYGINAYMLEGLPGAGRMGIHRMSQVREPSETITWADSIQINTFQPPATPSRPMLEEWYFLDGLPLPKFHFRHASRLNAAFADHSVQVLRPSLLDARCDGQAGYLGAPRDEYWLLTRKPESPVAARD